LSTNDTSGSTKYDIKLKRLVNAYYVKIGLEELLRASIEKSLPVITLKITKVSSI
tara:strand:+ start:656 stop:820 length:165 start_codon:yes stop_codon:yes gene_type:complete